MKYFIRGFFTDWHEVTKEKYEGFLIWLKKNTPGDYEHTKNKLTKIEEGEEERHNAILQIF